MAVLRTGQRVRISPRVVIRMRERETDYVHGLLKQHESGWDTRPSATIIRFPVERRLASTTDAS